MKKIRWGIVGTGAIANKFASCVKNVDSSELVAVASRSSDTGRAFGEKYNIPTVFCSYEAMAESDMVDAVYIATPHPFHMPCATLFMNHKKHVLCEKPLCVNAREASLLKECAQKNGVFLMEAMWTRFLPAINEAKGIADSGTIGDILGIRADFCYRCAPEEDPKLYSCDMAGGSLLDVGVYGLHFASIFLGEDPEEITAVANKVNGVDLQMCVNLKYKSGALCSVSSAIELHKPEDAYIFGTKGYIHIPTFYGAKELYVIIGDEQKHIIKPPLGDGFEEEIYECCRCIADGKNQSDIMPPDTTIKILEQMDKIREITGIHYPFDV